MGTTSATTLGTAFRYVAERFLELADEADRQGTTPEFYTPAEVAKLLKVHVETVYRWIRKGTLPAVELNGTYRIPADAVRSLA